MVRICYIVLGYIHILIYNLCNIVDQMVKNILDMMDRMPDIVEFLLSI
jgi:hypothetical protein